MLVLVLIMSATAKPIKDGAYLVWHPLQPSEDSYLWWMQINEDIIISDKPVVRDLGVLLDCELMIERHINQVARNCFYHIRRLKQIRRLLGLEVMVKLVMSLTFSRLDYCNAVLPGLSILIISPLQHNQNAAACLIAQLCPHDHMTAAMRNLHWLPV